MPTLSRLRMLSGRWLATYKRSVAESVTRFSASEELLAEASAAMENARTMRSERLPWCTSCGERLTLSGRLGSSATAVIHSRCHGR